jgi:GTPase SAR1 family protein
MTFNIVLLGMDSVGKSSIVSRVVDDLAGQRVFGDVADITFHVEEADVTLRIWDTGSFQLYRTTYGQFLRRSHSIAFVCSCTDPDASREFNQFSLTSMSRSSCLITGFFSPFASPRRISMTHLSHGRGAYSFRMSQVPS